VTLRLISDQAEVLFPLLEKERSMTWIKPEFEFVDLCSEVTSYLYTR
jgi:PqqA family protein